MERNFKIAISEIDQKLNINLPSESYKKENVSFSSDLT